MSSGTSVLLLYFKIDCLHIHCVLTPYYCMMSKNVNLKISDALKAIKKQFGDESVMLM